MFAHVTMAVGFLYVLSGFIAVSFLALLIIKSRHLWWDRKRQFIREKYRDYLAYVKANVSHESELKLPPLPMKKGEKQFLLTEFILLMETLQGEELTKLITLCHQVGFVQRELRRVRSRFPLKRMDAVYNLGVMRVAEAVPLLQQLLKRSSNDANLFIIAQSIFHTTQDLRIILETISHVLRNQPSAYTLLVEMLRDAPLDSRELYSVMIESTEPALVKMGLVGLNGNMDPALAGAIAPLLEAKDKEVRVEAAALLLQLPDSHTADKLAPFLTHPDWEIRALAAETIGQKRLDHYLYLLPSTLTDPVWQVRYSGATSMASLGTEGFAALCQLAATSKKAATVETAQRVLAEVLQRYGYNRQNKEELRKYYDYAHIYEQYFGETPSYHQAI